MNKIPEMQEIYNKYYKDEKYYNFYHYSNTLAIYLGFKNLQYLNDWIYSNHKIWGIGYHRPIFYSSLAWEQKEDNFSHKIIIKKLESVYNNLIKKENE